MTYILAKQADNNYEKSLATKLRRKRFEIFLKLISKLPKPIKIIDFGGTISFWNMMNFLPSKDIQITLVNKAKQKQENNLGFKIIEQDITKLNNIKSKQYDIAFSNSTIEHLSTYENQKNMSLEMNRIAKHIFLQTPNKYFPIEPHTLFPFMQFLPKRFQIYLILKFDLCRYGIKNDLTRAQNKVNELRLLNKKEIKILFKDCKIYEEKLFFITKSFIVYK